MCAQRVCVCTVCVCVCGYTSVPRSPLEPRGRPLENKAELVTLTVGDDDVLQLLHDRAGAAAHQLQRPVVVGLRERVLLRKPETRRRKERLKSGHTTSLTFDLPSDQEQLPENRRKKTFTGKIGKKTLQESNRGGSIDVM